MSPCHSFSKCTPNEENSSARATPIEIASPDSVSHLPLFGFTLGEGGPKFADAGDPIRTSLVWQLATARPGSPKIRERVGRGTELGHLRLRQPSAPIGIPMMKRIELR